MQWEAASGVVCLFGEILFKICALCAEVMQILGNTVLLVLCEATLSEGHYLTTVVAHFLVPGLTYTTGMCNEQHFFVFDLCLRVEGTIWHILFNYDK